MASLLSGPLQKHLPNPPLGTCQLGMKKGFLKMPKILTTLMPPLSPCANAQAHSLNIKIVEFGTFKLSDMNTLVDS